MNIRNRRAIRNAAGQALAAAPKDPKRVALVYAAGSGLLALVVAVVSSLFSSQISHTGGLGNMGLRSILSTGQAVLPLVQMLILLCWDMGYTIATLKMARRQEAVPQTLLEGFRLFGPVLRAVLLQCLIYFAMAFGAAYLSSFIFLMLPVSQPFYALMEPLLDSASMLDSGIVMDEATLSAATSAMLPMMLIFLVIFCAAALPVYYQYRMVSYCLADDPRKGALAAMRESRAMMRRNRMALLKLDLGFWWFYGLQLLIGIICYLDVLLPLAGVTFPWSDTVSYFLFYVLSLIAQTVVFYFALNRVHVTYATAYEALRPKPQSNGVALGNIFNM